MPYIDAVPEVWSAWEKGETQDLCKLARLADKDGDGLSLLSIVWLWWYTGTLEDGKHI